MVKSASAGWRRLSLGLLVMCGMAAPAVAQEPQQPPPPQQGGTPIRRIFQSERVPRGPQALDLTLGFSGSYDDNVFGELLAQPDPRLSEAGMYPTGRADVQYTARNQTVSFNFNSNNTVQYFPRLNGRLDHTHLVGASLTLNVTPRTQIVAAHTANFAPFYLLLGLNQALGAQAIVAPETPFLNPNPRTFGVTASNAWDHRARLGVLQRLGNRDTLEGRLVYVRSDFGPSTYTEVGGVYRHTLRRNTALRAGYGRQRER